MVYLIDSFRSSFKKSSKSFFFLNLNPFFRNSSKNFSANFSKDSVFTDFPKNSLGILLSTVFNEFLQTIFQKFVWITLQYSFTNFFRNLCWDSFGQSSRDNVLENPLRISSEINQSCFQCFFWKMFGRFL